MKKKIAFIGLVAGLSVLSCIPAFAGQWKQDSKGWWWEEDDGYYPTLAWKWVDGNHDDVYECYWFDRDGYAKVNTTINGSKVNEDGAWVIDGVVQLLDRRNQKPGINPVLLEDIKLTFGELKAKYGEYTLGTGRTYIFPYGKGEYAHDGTGVGFVNSSLTYRDETPSFFGPSSSTNYIFYESKDELNDNCKIQAIKTSQVFTGLPAECSLDEFETFLKDIGAEQIHIINKVIPHKKMTKTGYEMRNARVTGVRFVYDGVWFYVNGRYSESGSKIYTTYRDGAYPEIRVYTEKNEYEEYNQSEECWSKTVPYSYLAG